MSAYFVEVDLTDVLDMQSHAIAELRKVPAAMARVGADAAKSSRQHHLYQNRTGETQRQTRAVSERGNDAAYTLVTIHVPHASYLMKGGTSRRHESLTALEDAIEQAEKELDFFMDGLGNDLDR